MPSDDYASPNAVRPATSAPRPTDGGGGNGNKKGGDKKGGKLFGLPMNFWLIIIVVGPASLVLSQAPGEIGVFAGMIWSWYAAILHMIGAVLAVLGNLLLTASQFLAGLPG